MTRYSTLSTALLAVLATVVVAPLPASAACPGCEEYVLDIEDDPPPANTPAPAPVPVAPAAPVPTTATPTEAIPVAPVVEAEKPQKPVDPDPDPVPGQGVKPPSLDNVPAIAAAQAGATDAGTEGGVLPLAIAMGMIALVAAVLGFRSRPAADTSPGPRTERG
ncbi:MAG: hypothetical protein ACR2OC_07630 [Solirubrobacterales bacterium]